MANRSQSLETPIVPNLPTPGKVYEEMVADQPTETLPVKRGDAVFFHDLTLHASCPNSNGQDRWTAIATYRSGGRKDSSTVWKSGLVLSGRSVNLA